jgi:hypothetical protein
MKRLLLVVVVVVVAFVGTAQTARADGPVRIPVLYLDFFTNVCGYYLGVTVVESSRVETVFSDGRRTDTGNLVLRVTHLDGGSSIVRDASGPLFFTMNAVTGTGNTLWEIDDAVYFVRGQATLVFNPDGTSTFSYTGQIENLCDTLR